MTDRMQDTVLSILLLLLAGIWIWLVSTTIPGGLGRGDVGPRAFPLTFGIALAILSGLLLLRLFLSRVDAAATEAAARSQIEWLPAILVLLEISLYGFLLQKTGFLIATPVVILLIMLVNLRVHSLKAVIGMSLGVTIGAWAVFEKLLGMYLANGTWINLG